jgi:hypothetical protein
MRQDYAYKLDQCDVPQDRRSELQRFRAKRAEWLSWLETDEHHAIWSTLHSMVWADVAFKTLTGLAIDNEENALNNSLVMEAMLNGHVATQVLGIRRLMDRGRGNISLRRLIIEVGSCFELFTRENYVCFDGDPYDYQTVRDARIRQLLREDGKPGFHAGWVPFSGPEGDGASELAHMQFDRLAGIDPAKRTRQDRLPRRLLKTIEKWLVDSDADDLAEWSHRYLAHGGDRLSRQEIAHLNVTANKITEAIKGLSRATEGMAMLLFAGGRSGALMPTAQFNQFEKLDKPIMRERNRQSGHGRWHSLSTVWDRCLDGVEGDLVSQPQSDEAQT